MNENFKTAIKFVLAHEGGYVNDPKDPGGETNHGISKRSYPHLDIKNLTVDQAVEIYYRDYWERAGCQCLAWPYDLIMFDCAVNHGIAQAQKFNPVSSNGSGRTWIDTLVDRIKFYVSLNRPVFLAGWINRVLDLYFICKASGPSGPTAQREAPK